MTDVELRDELMTMLMAGHETTATGLAFAFDLLPRNPRVPRPPARRAGRRGRHLPRCRGHRDAAAAAGDRRRERTLTKPRTIGGWDLPAGIRVYPAIAVVHLREDLYPQPHEFRPERFIEEEAPVLRLAAVRRRHPPLHRRRARAGRDGGGDPHRRLARRPRTDAARSRTGGHARHHARPAPRHAGPSAARGRRAPRRSRRPMGTFAASS